MLRASRPVYCIASARIKNDIGNNSLKRIQERLRRPQPVSQKRNDYLSVTHSAATGQAQPRYSSQPRSLAQGDFHPCTLARSHRLTTYGSAE